MKIFYERRVEEIPCRKRTKRQRQKFKSCWHLNKQLKKLFLSLSTLCEKKFFFFFRNNDDNIQFIMNDGFYGGARYIRNCYIFSHRHYCCSPSTSSLFLLFSTTIYTMFSCFEVWIIESHWYWAQHLKLLCCCVVKVEEIVDVVLFSINFLNRLTFSLY